MPASLRFVAKGDIWGSLRRPSRNLISCQWVKNTGWPASDGVPGMVVLPSAPWQLLHGSALRRPASRSAVAGAKAVTARAAAMTWGPARARGSEEHTSELQSRLHLVCRLLLEKK